MDQPLTSLQLTVLRVLWSRGESTVREVQEALAADRRYAYTTVATLLTRLEARGAVRRRRRGRRYVYTPVVSEAEVQALAVEALADVTDDLFDGSLVAVMSQLLRSRDIDAEELRRIKSLIEEYDRRHARKDDAR